MRKETVRNAIVAAMLMATPMLGGDKVNHFWYTESGKFVCELSSLKINDKLMVPGLDMPYEKDRMVVSFQNKGEMKVTISTPDYPGQDADKMTVTKEYTSTDLGGLGVDKYIMTGEIKNKDDETGKINARYILPRVATKDGFMLAHFLNKIENGEKTDETKMFLCQKQ